MVLTDKNIKLEKTNFMDVTDSSILDLTKKPARLYPYQQSCLVRNVSDG